MKYDITQCDLCGMESYNDEGFTIIDLGTKLIGFKDYKDICPQCTLWVIQTLDKRIKSK